MARSILNTHNQRLIGQPIEAIADMDAILMTCLEGNQYSRLRRCVSTDRGQFEFFTSARPIVDSTGRIIGAVEIMKAIEEIKALAKEADQQKLKWIHESSRPPTETWSAWWKLAHSGRIYITA